mmetsp:Transcript_21490/g.37984  ORF Transcript_21490/g.37984 Transcript_21490/m.37984 type:complete len:272 (+) Transcript_21490:1492-2307(+)
MVSVRSVPAVVTVPRISPATWWPISRPAARFRRVRVVGRPTRGFLISTVAVVVVRSPAGVQSKYIWFIWHGGRATTAPWPGTIPRCLVVGSALPATLSVPVIHGVSRVGPTTTIIPFPVSFSKPVAVSVSISTPVPWPLSVVVAWAGLMPGLTWLLNPNCTIAYPGPVFNMYFIKGFIFCPSPEYFGNLLTFFFRRSSKLFDQAFHPLFEEVSKVARFELLPFKVKHCAEDIECRKFPVGPILVEKPCESVDHVLALVVQLDRRGCGSFYF